MFRTSCLLLVLASFIACKKSSNPASPVVKDSVSIKAVDSNVVLVVSMDTSVGVVLSSHSPDTFLIRLNDPSSIAAIPVVYHIGTESKVNSGVIGKDSLWRDTINLQNNAVKGITVTAKNGKIANYFIGFQYVIENHLLPGVANRLLWKGDTLYAATSAGLYFSVDDGKNFTQIPALGNQSVFGFYARGRSIFAGLVDRLAISTDEGRSFSDVTFAPRVAGGDGFAAVSDISAQGDTIYFATWNGVRISRDGGNSFDSTISDLFFNGFTQVDCIAAAGSYVFAGTRFAFYVSADGGKSFTMDNNLKNPNLAGATIQCNSVAIQNNVLYVGLNGICRSTDNGGSFSLGLFSNGIGKPVTYISTSDSLVAVSTVYGLAISADAGRTYTTYLGQSGVGGGTLNNAISAAIKGKTIYSGFNNNYLSILRPRF